jgi:hypothetical protein
MTSNSLLEDTSLQFNNGVVLNVGMNATSGIMTFSSNSGDVLLSGVLDPITLQDAATKNYSNKYDIKSPTFVTSAASTTNLSSSSNSFQILTGSTTQTYRLPDATTLDLGCIFTFENQSTGLLTVNDFSSTTITTVSNTFYKSIICTDISTSSGSWIVLDSGGGGGGVTSVSGTTNRITSTGGLTPVIDISSAYVGQTSITTLGTITSGTWNGGIISGNYGGTGVANVGKTITLGDNFTTSGAFPITLTVTGATNVTLPTSGTLLSNTPAALTEVDDTNVTLTLGGTPSTALLQATSITAGWSGQLSLARGGTNASLVASNGGIFYSTATGGSILSGTVTANQVLLSGSATAPYWSTATYPPDTTVNQVLYSSATNTVNGLATANNGVLVTSAGGVPSISSTLPTAVQGNITTLGTVTSGTWNGGIISGTYGGTGVNNSTRTITTTDSITIGSTSTASQLFYTSSAGTISGLTTTSNAGLLSTGGTLSWVTYTGTGAPVLANTPTLITPDIGAATGTSLTTTGALRSATSIILEDPGAGTNTATIQAPTIGTSYTYTLPTNVGTISQVLTTDGNNPATLSWANKSNVVITFLTTGTTYTTPSTITTSTVFKITVIGGGGGGGGSNGGTARGAGGAGGGSGIVTVSGLSPSTGYTYAIGAAGAAGTGAPTAGGAGGNTSITINATTYTANGGTGGGVGGANALGGTGGTTVNCTISVPGQNGTSTVNSADTSGDGGASLYGFGGNGVFPPGNPGNPGNPGTGYGSGGGGGAGSGARVGGAGTAGAIVIEYVV